MVQVPTDENLTIEWISTIPYFRMQNAEIPSLRIIQFEKSSKSSTGQPSPSIHRKSIQKTKNIALEVVWFEMRRERHHENITQTPPTIPNPPQP